MHTVKLQINAGSKINAGSLINAGVLGLKEMSNLCSNTKLSEYQPYTKLLYIISTQTLIADADNS